MPKSRSEVGCPNRISSGAHGSGQEDQHWKQPEGAVGGGQDDQTDQRQRQGHQVGRHAEGHGDRMCAVLPQPHQQNGGRLRQDLAGRTCVFDDREGMSQEDLLDVIGAVGIKAAQSDAGPDLHDQDRSQGHGERYPAHTLRTKKGGHSDIVSERPPF